MKEKTQRTFLRQMHMLSLLKRWPTKTATTELRARLESAGYGVDLRTIQRDLNNLTKSYGLVSDESKPQGWCWAKDAPQLDYPAMQPDEALVFYMAATYLRPILPDSTFNALLPWFKRASTVLEGQGKGLAEWRKKVRVLAPGQPLLPAAIDEGVHETVTQALLLNRKFEVQYRARQATTDKNYVVNPLGLVVRDQMHYLVCTLRDYSDIRQLVLNRMHSPVLLHEKSNALKGFDLDDYIAAGEFGTPAESGKKIKLVANFSGHAASIIRERPLAQNQKIEETDDKTMRLTVTVMDTAELRMWLLGLGGQVEVESPQTLRNYIWETACAMSFNHKGDSAI